MHTCFQVIKTWVITTIIFHTRQPLYLLFQTNCGLMSQKKTFGKCMFRVILHYRSVWLENSILHSFYLFQEQTLPPRPEAYPIPTQTYTREYFTFPASKSQDRMGPTQSQWPNYEEKPQVQAESNHSINSTMQVSSNFFQYKKKKKKTERNFLLSIPRLLETFLQNSQLCSLWAVDDKLYHGRGNNSTFAKIGLGSETVLPPPPPVSPPVPPPLLHHCRICGITSCRSAVWGVLMTG